MDSASTTRLLVEVRDLKLSLPELCSECADIKQLCKIQVAFLKVVNCTSWAEAEEQFPEFTKTDMLEPFKRLNFSGSTLPDSFMKYCQSAIKSKVTCEKPTQHVNCTSTDMDDLFFIEHNDCMGIYWKKDIFDVTREKLERMMERVGVL